MPPDPWTLINVKAPKGSPLSVPVRRIDDCREIPDGAGSPAAKGKRIPNRDSHRDSSRARYKVA